MAKGKRITWRNRIVGHEEVDPAQLLANPFNFRRHPGEQMDALRGSLGEVGWVKEVIVNKRTGHVVDGHARIEEAMRQNEKVPVTYIDVSEAEEKLLLAVLDPITEMAKQDDDALAALLADVDTEDPGLRALLMDLEGEEKKPVEVKELQVSDLTEERFWMSVRGPGPQQMAALEKLKAALEDLPGVEVDVGWTMVN